MHDDNTPSWRTGTGRCARDNINVGRRIFLTRTEHTVGFAYSCSKSANYFRFVYVFAYARVGKIMFINPTDAFHLHNLKHNTNMNEHGEKRNK